MKLFPGLEVNETDTITTAVSKGMAKGALQSSLFWLTVAGAVYVTGKILEIKEEKVETEEEEVKE